MGKNLILGPILGPKIFFVVFISASSLFQAIILRNLKKN